MYGPLNTWFDAYLQAGGAARLDIVTSTCGAPGISISTGIIRRHVRRTLHLRSQRTTRPIGRSWIASAWNQGRVRIMTYPDILDVACELCRALGLTAAGASVLVDMTDPQARPQRKPWGTA